MEKEVNQDNLVDSILYKMSKLDPEERVFIIEELSREICFQCGSLMEVCYCDFEE